MKKLLIALSFLALVSCKKEAENKQIIPATDNYTEGNAAEVKSPAELGKLVFEGKGNCTACHLVDQKVIGPSIQEIAKIYKEKEGDMVAFLKAKADPIVDPSQFEVMKANFEILKTLSDEEINSLEAYIYSSLK